MYRELESFGGSRSRLCKGVELRGKLRFANNRQFKVGRGKTKLVIRKEEKE